MKFSKQFFVMRNMGWVDDLLIDNFILIILIQIYG
jgi:hypothetical protein